MSAISLPCARPQRIKAQTEGSGVSTTVLTGGIKTVWQWFLSKILPTRSTFLPLSLIAAVSYGKGSQKMLMARQLADVEDLYRRERELRLIFVSQQRDPLLLGLMIAMWGMLGLIVLRIADYHFSVLAKAAFLWEFILSIC